MSDDNKQTAGDHDGTKNSDLDTEKPSTTQEGEEKHDDLSDEEKATAAEINRQKQIDVYFNRVKNGDITLDQIPANLGWVKSAVQKRLEPNTNKLIVSKDLVKQVIEEERQEEKYSTLLGDLKDGASESDFKSVEAKFNELVANGMTNKALALETAIAACGVKLQTEKDVRRANMAIPRASYHKPKGSENISKTSSWSDLEGVQNLPPSERAKYYGKLLE